MIRAIKLVEPRLRVLQADSFSHSCMSCGPETRSVVANSESHHAVLARRRDINHSRLRPRRNAMSNRVFDEGLQDQIRHGRSQDRRVDIHSDRQSIVKTRLFDLQIVVQKLEFFS